MEILYNRVVPRKILVVDDKLHFLNILQYWHTLSIEGDLLTIEDEANALLQKDSRYAPFVEEIQKYTSSMDIEETIRFLEGFLTEK